MKFIIVLVLLGIASSVHCQGKDSLFLAIDNYLETTGLQFREPCIQETGVDEALVVKLEKEAEMTPDDKLKCYIRCQGAKSKVVDEAGVIDIDAVKRVLKATNQKFLDMVESDCKIPKNTHLCEAAYEVAICVFDVLSDHHHIH